MLETLIFLVRLDHLCEVGNELICLGEEVCQSLVLLFINELTVALLILQHEATQTFLLYTFLLLLLLPLGIHVVHQESLVEFVDLQAVLTVELPEKDTMD